MSIRTRSAFAVLGMASVAVLGLAGCSMSSTPAETTPAETSTPTPTETTPTMDPAADLVGPGCADYAAMVPDGAGSVTGMAADPVAVAASNNPLLTTLVAAVSGQVNPDVDLVDTLNSGEYTVFAPVDEAFAAVRADTMEALAGDADLLTSVLTYHVIDGQILPEDLPGEHETLNGATVEVTGSGDSLQVNGANVICGGVHTANATVYLIDAVLVPES